MKEPQGQPARFFVGAERALSIATDFANFGADIAQLRKRLRQRWRGAVRQLSPVCRMVPTPLRHRERAGAGAVPQTVSMKSVGNLTDFVRSHMLEPFDVAPRVQALIAHFDDLNRAHQAVLKAQQQVELLTPLVADCGRHRVPGR
jgi:uncharacterized protein YPO0396